MKIVVVGGSGLIGRKVVARLRGKGHEVLAASPSSGVDTLTGKGLAPALAGASVVVDLANSPSFEEQAVLAFFRTAGRQLAAAETTAGTAHHVALSVVGAERLHASAYMRGKLVQEESIRGSGVPYTIIHSTQFFEFLGHIADDGAVGAGTVRLSTGQVQPIAAEDVADAVADIALSAPAMGVREIAGPNAFPMADIVRRYLELSGDARRVLADPQAPYFGAVLQPGSLLPGAGARLGKLDFRTWFSRFSRGEA
jgi:uncharacterized protein YbjT (DUF2867 family)